MFGDVRGVNVMLTKSGSTNLIDFDWVAKERKGRYPPLLNADLITTELAPDVSPHGFMYKKHDAYGLVKLFSRHRADEDYRKAKVFRAERQLCLHYQV